MATSCPASRYSFTARAASMWAAFCTAGSRLMAKRSGRMVLPLSSTAPFAMSSASIPPFGVWGAAMTGQFSRQRTACRVMSSGSPGPTLTP